MERVRPVKEETTPTGRVRSERLPPPHELPRKPAKPCPDPKDVPLVDTSGYSPLVLVPGNAKVRLGWRVKDHGDGTEAWLWYVGVVLVAVASKSPMHITMTCRHALSGTVQNEHRIYDTMQELQRDLLAMLQETAP